MFLVECVLCAPAPALQDPSLRWDLWRLHPADGVRGLAGAVWPERVGILEISAEETGREADPTFASVTWNGIRFRRLPVTWISSLHKPIGRAFLAEEDGHRVRAHLWSALEGGVEAGLHPRWRIRIDGTLTAQEAGSWKGRARQLFLEWRPGRHELRLGRSVTRWGSGAIGSILLGRSAPPKWQLSWRTRKPVPLPWVLRPAGTWSAAAFLAYLDDEHRTIPNPLLLGHRTSWQPTDWFEITGTRTILFGGDDRTERLTLRSLWEILTVQNENLVGERPPSDSDQRASLELRALVPWIEGWNGVERVEVFWEYAGEDVNDPPLPSAVAHHYGGAVGWRGWIVRGEFAETVTGRNRWYYHTVYKDAYFYRGLVMGLPQGGDSRNLWAGIWTPEGPLQLRLIREEQTFGLLARVDEVRVRWELGGLLRLSEVWQLEASLSATRRRGPGRDPAAPGFLRDQLLVRLIRR